MADMDISLDDFFSVSLPRRQMAVSSRGMIPRSAATLLPFMVCVLPLPVAPYAKMVTSFPLNRCFNVGETARGKRVVLAIRRLPLRVQHSTLTF